MISKCLSGSDRYLFASIAVLGGIALVVIEEDHANCFVAQPLGMTLATTKPLRKQVRSLHPPPPFAQRNLTIASVVSFGRSSRIQWPVSFKTTTVTSVATSFICAASSLPNDLSPPIDNTGIINFVWEICAKSLASCGHEAK
jgi:hypothetical protein